MSPTLYIILDNFGYLLYAVYFVMASILFKKMVLSLRAGDEAPENFGHLSMDKKIKDILKAENLSWAKLALVLGGGDRSSLKVKVEGWAIKLNDTFNKIGYEVTFQKINENSKGTDKKDG